MKICYDDSHTGSGKTDRALDDIVKNKCKAIFATERVESFVELETWIRKKAAQHGTAPVIDKVNGSQRQRLGSVSRQIAELPVRHELADHVIVIITHEGMMQSDFSAFGDWDIIVDEVPPILNSEEKRTHLDAGFFQLHYELEEKEGGWCSVKVTGAGSKLTVANVLADQSHNHLAVFHRRVLEASRAGSNRVVVVNLKNWDRMSDSEVKWFWASAFSLKELEPFKSVKVLGNRYRHNVGALIAQSVSGDEIEWEALPSPSYKRHFQFRPVHICYFSETRTASRTLFESAAGQVMLREIGARLKQELGASDHIWTANKADRGIPTPKSVLLSGGMDDARYLSPKQAGTNRHKRASHAAVIYSAKACNNLRTLLKTMGIDQAAWVRSIELEAILQFVTRTSVRDPDNCSPVRLWVFDRKQALYLKEYFDGLGFASATISLVTDGPAIPAEEKRGPKPKVYTPSEQDRRREEKRAKDRERKQRSRDRQKQPLKAAGAQDNQAA